MIKFQTLFVILLLSVNAGAQDFVVSSPVVVAAGYGNYHPQAEVLGDGEMGVIWTSASSNNLYFAKRNGPDQFNVTVQLNPVGLEVQDYNWSGADLAVEGSNVYVIFRSLGYETGHIYLVKSTDNGQTFGDTVRVDNMADAYGQFPDIAVYDDTAYVTYMKHGFTVMNPQFVVSRSVNGGASFEAEVDVTSWTGLEACDCCQGEILADGQRVIVFYRENDFNTRDIKGMISHDRGLTFTQFLDIDNHNWVIAACPSTGADARFESDNVSLTAYRTTISGTAKLFLEETNLTTATSISTTDIYMDGASNGGINYPQLACTDNLIAMCWEGLGNGTDIFFNASQSGPAGMLPANAINVTDLTSSQSKPDLVIMNGAFHIVYAELSGSEVHYVTIGAVNETDNGIQHDLSVYPNPFSDEIRIANYSGGQTLVKIYALDGALVHQQWLLADGTIQTPHLAPGVYTLHLITPDGSDMQRVVKN